MNNEPSGMSGSTLQKEKRGSPRLPFGSASGGGKLPLLLLLCGAIGVLLLFFGGKAGKKNSDVQTDETKTEEEATQKELETLLSGIAGVGQVKLYLSFQPEGTAESGAHRLHGIAVLCQGGEDPAVQKRVISLLTALYDLGAHRIYVGDLNAEADSG